MPPSLPSYSLDVLESQPCLRSRLDNPRIRQMLIDLPPADPSAVLDLCGTIARTRRREVCATVSNIMTIEKLLQYINGLDGLPAGTLVFALCLGFGWVIKRLPRIDNSAIPLVVVLMGAIIKPVLSDWNASPLHYVHQFIARQVVIGAIIGMSATLSHRFVIKRLLARFGLEDPANNSTKGA